MAIEAAETQRRPAPETAGARLARNGGSTTGFDYLRIGLAASVVLWHSLEASYSDGTSVRVWHEARGVISLILPMFFALSGFLVCGSLIRTKSVVVFMSHRFLRLIPALCVEVLLSALLLGPILTTEPRATYFQDVEFRQYFLNIVGSIHYHLPGVFLANPSSGIVNRSLWTIPYELECYLALIIVSMIGLTGRRIVLTCLIGLASVALLAITNLHHSAVLFGVGPPGRLLVLSFLAGVALYLWRDIIPLSWPLFIAAAVLSIVILSFSQLMFLAAFPVAYVTMWLGLTNPRHIPVLMDGDYSYGLYLFAYPLQQTFSALFPHERHWYSNVCFALFFGLLYAFFSWNVIEKRVLSHRKRVTIFIQELVAWPGQLIGRA